MVKVEIKNITKGKNEGDFYVSFDYLGKEAQTLYNSKVRTALKVEKLLSIGGHIEVLRSIFPSKNDPSKPTAFFKMVEVY